MTAPPTDALGDLRHALTTGWTAAEHVQPHRIDMHLAGLDVRIELAGDRLHDVVSPALETHRPAVGAPVARVRAYDAAATGAPMPPRQWRPDDQHLRWAPTPAAPGGIRWTWHEHSGTGLFSDPEGVGHLSAVTDARQLPWYELGAPLRQALAWALAPHGRHFVHCAAVGRADGAVLLVGPSGAGKTSTAVAGLLAGLHFLGDDYCVLTLDDGPVVHTLYGTCKLQPDQLALVDRDAHLAPHLLHLGGDDSKAIAVASRWAPDLVIPSAPVRAVIVPSTDGPAGLTPLPAATTLRHLAPTSVLQLSGAGAEDLAALAALVRSVPCYRLGLLPDRAANPPALLALLDLVAR